ncbi:MAG: S-layer protein [Blastopirellula sp.]|nr:MAG: S-layer protein [Blastopirellula sp.]
MNRLIPLLIISICWVHSAHAQSSIELLPPQVELSSSVSIQKMIVQAKLGEELGQQLTADLTWTSSDIKVAEVKQGVVVPKSNGTATITVKQGDQTATAKVTVTGMEKPFQWSFRNHVQPVLAKKGCNTGGCHGALSGKGGFKLSLQGYDSDADYFNIVKQDRGRRVEFFDPARSLFLTKPSTAIPHKGGLRLDVDTQEYEIVSQWIAAGAKPPQDADPIVERLEIFPKQSLHKLGESQQFVVNAVYSDGRTEDVTRWVKWSSTNDAVCQIDDTGTASTVGPGEGAIVAWYASKLAIARATVPFQQKDKSVSDKKADQRKPKNLIDEQVDRQLARLNLTASGNCTESEFVRRVYIDTVGRLPSVEETREFLTDSSAEKRDQLIDQLLASSDFVDYWTYQWSDILMLNGNLLRPDPLKAYYQFVYDHVEKNTPWDEFVRQIVTSTGVSTENGATNFFALHQTPEDMTENASQAFLGLSIGCAKCHNHPLEKWTNDQYYAMANMFSRVKAKGWGGETRNGSGVRTLYVVNSGELVQPRTGKPQPPTPLDGRPLAFDDTSDRRVAFGDWLTSTENPYFARAITNRIWANYFGVGLVESVDDLRVSNPASNEPLLAALEAFVIENKFDLKALMKIILQSNAYQRTSRVLDGNREDTRFYSRYYPKRMKAEVLHDAIVQVSKVPSKFEWIAFAGTDRQKTDAYPLGTRAVQLYDSAVENYFLQTFGRNQRRIVCECERSSEPTVIQVLHISNGSTINDKLKDEKSRVASLLKLRSQGMSDATLIDELYLAALSRYPTTEERKRLSEFIPVVGDSDERPVIEDLFWGVLSSREFLFNH